MSFSLDINCFLEVFPDSEEVNKYLFEEDFIGLLEYLKKLLSVEREQNEELKEVTLEFSKNAEIGDITLLEEIENNYRLISLQYQKIKYLEDLILQVEMFLKLK